MNRLALLLGPCAAIALAGFMLNGAQPPQTGPATEKRFPPLKVPPGFKATLFACDPLIEYPSVISIGPKPGSIFVAIDYMTGLGTDGKAKSEIRLVEDTDGDGYADKVTVVAKGFNSIQGLAYHEGTLYVMHAPFLTTVRGNERKDLLSGLGLTPEQNPVRLHCANGVIVGHDGWLYLAMGDNGVNVPRPEGDRLIHNGGAILRCRPDGRDLHVFSTGLRNIYDIALDAELNVFTRDNENDGGTYMIRVCHCFHGSDHGYPYHYEERKAEAMPPIGDFGLGSSAGGVCYLEKQFPPEYRGNLFFSEWGKSVVRYPLQRQGSGFAPVKEFEFAAGDSKDTYPFKPTDIVVQRDGTLIVSDYADGQRPKRGRGRIYHISYVGQESDLAKQPASKLDSESYYDRWEAQSTIERSGKGPAIDKFGPRGRLHGIWALAKIEGPKAIDDILQIAKTDPEPSVRAQAIRAIADLADPVLVKHKLDAGPGEVKLAERLAALAKGQDQRAVLEIVIALGRLRWAGAPEWLRKNLTQPDAALAHAAQQTMRRSENWPAILKILDEPEDTQVRKIALRTIVERYEPQVVDGLILRMGEASQADRRREYGDALTRVYKKPAPWKYWGYRPGPRPANTEAWTKTDAIGNALHKALADGDGSVRFAILKSMLREKAPIAAPALIAWLKEERDPNRAALVIPLLGADGSMEARRALYIAGVNGKIGDANRLLALDLYFKDAGADLRKDLLNAVADLSVEHGPVLADVLQRLGRNPNFAQPILFVNMARSKSPEVRAAAVDAIGSLRLQEGHELALQLLGDTDARVRRAAASAVGQLRAKEAIEPLLKLARESNIGVRGACLESLRVLKELRVVSFAVTALNEPVLELKALECLSELGGPDQAKAVAEFGKRNPSSEGTAAAVRLLTAWRNHNTVTDEQRQELDRAIAEIHGAGGILVRWLADRPPATHFAVGAESRLTLPSTDVGVTPFQFVTEIAVAKPTPVEFLASSRGPLEIQQNGHKIFQRPQSGKFQIGADRFPATLEAGINRIRVDVSARDGLIDFHLNFRRKSPKAEHEKLTQAALTRTGNAERGKKLFFDKEKSQCIKCHQIAGQGERIGPELTGVGGRFSRIYLVESILEPSRTIAPSFGTIVVTLKNGKALNGVKLAETDKDLTLADNQGMKHVLLKADIEEANPSPISTMPEGLEQRMTADEFVDMIAFLASQKEKR